MVIKLGNNILFVFVIIFETLPDLSIFFFFLTNEYQLTALDEAQNAEAKLWSDVSVGLLSPVT